LIPYCSKGSFIFFEWTGKLTAETQVLEETKGLLKKALDLNQHANTLYDQIQQKRKEKGE